MNYEAQVYRLGVYRQFLAKEIVNAKEWDVVVARQMSLVLPYSKEELKKAHIYQHDTSEDIDVELIFPSYLRFFLKDLEIKKQWVNLTTYDKSLFSPDAVKAISSLTAIYFLSLNFLFLYLRSDKDMSYSENFEKIKGKSPVSEKLFLYFFKAMETFHVGGELYESLKEVVPKGKNLGVELTSNDCDFFNFTAARLAYSFLIYSRKGGTTVSTKTP